MPNKCCVGNCKANYSSTRRKRFLSRQPRIQVYKFPQDKEEKERWRLSLPNQVEVRTVDSNYGLLRLQKIKVDTKLKHLLSNDFGPLT